MSNAAHLNANIDRDLEIMGRADNYYSWIIDEVRPFLGSRILECGSGKGSVTAKLLNCNLTKLIASDYDVNYLSQLRRICAKYSFAEVMMLDLENITESGLKEIHHARLDTILMINVLEHISDDISSVRVLNTALGAGGNIITFCPAFDFLYGKLDRSYGHYRRYSKESVKLLAKKAGLEVAFMKYCNMPGFFAWLILHKLFNIEALNENSVSVFNKMAPLIRTIESYIKPVVGLSILSILTKR